GYPIRKGEVAEADGYTANQKEGFKAQDFDGDGFIASDEWLTEDSLHNIEEITEIIALTLYMSALDSNKDESISRDELSKLYPGGEEMYPESFPLEEAIHHLRVMDHELRHEMANLITGEGIR
ncbi:MAG: hypothetical protein AAGB46_16110, partial [Verrucomicrobiota bacterium]